MDFGLQLAALPAKDLLQSARSAEEWGYASLYVNPRGSVGHGQEFTRRADWGEKDFGDIMAAKRRRAGVVGMLDGAAERGREGLPIQALGVSEGAGKAPCDGVDDRHGRHLAAGQDEGAKRDRVACEVLVHPLVEAFVATAQEDELVDGGKLPRHRIAELPAPRRQPMSLEYAQPGVRQRIVVCAEQRLRVNHPWPM